MHSALHFNILYIRVIKTEKKIKKIYYIIELNAPVDPISGSGSLNSSKENISMSF